MICGSCANNHGHDVGVFCALVLPAHQHARHVLERVSPPDDVVLEAMRTFVATLADAAPR